MEVFINVVGQKLKIATNCRTFVEGSNNFIKLTFILSDEWSGLEKKAQFIQDGTAYDAFLDGNNSVYLPARIHDGRCELILFGMSGVTTAITGGLILNIKGTNYTGEGKDVSLVMTTIEEMKEHLNS